MPRYPVDPHYTYSNIFKIFKIPHYSSSADLVSSDVINNIHIFSPTWPTPAGRAPAGRTTNKCMLSSISIHGVLHAATDVLRITPFGLASELTNETTQYPTNKVFTSAWRFMVIKWNPYLNQSQPTQQDIFLWFYHTFVYYGEYALETDEQPNKPSAHCNLMRMSTDYTGTFQIIADKRFWLTADKPRVEISWQVPLNERATFDPDATDAVPPVTPLYSVVIIPPFSLDDFDQITREYITERLTSSTQKRLAAFSGITKLNFIDL